MTLQNERCHENASDCLRLDRCGGDAGDASTCLLLTRLPSRRTMPGVLRSVPAILRSVPAILRSAPAILWSIALLCSAPAILWSIALLCSAPAILRLRLGQPNRIRQRTGRRRADGRERLTSMGGCQWRISKQTAVYKIVVVGRSLLPRSRIQSFGKKRLRV